MGAPLESSGISHSRRFTAVWTAWVLSGAAAFACSFLPIALNTNFLPYLGNVSTDFWVISTVIDAVLQYLVLSLLVGAGFRRSAVWFPASLGYLVIVIGLFYLESQQDVLGHFWIFIGMPDLTYFILALFAVEGAVLGLTQGGAMALIFRTGRAFRLWLVASIVGSFVLGLSYTFLGMYWGELSVTNPWSLLAAAAVAGGLLGAITGAALIGLMWRKLRSETVLATA